MVPLLISPNHLRVLFLGGGNVAMRKAEHLKDCRITVVAESIKEELKEIAHKVVEDRIHEDSLSLIEQHDLVIAATDDEELNSRIVERCISSNILVNSVDGGGNFMIPSTLRRDHYTVCASTEGLAPVFPPFLIGILEGILDPAYDDMARLISELRLELKERLPDQKKRAEALEKVLRDPLAWEALGEDDETALATMRRIAGAGL